MSSVQWGIPSITVEKVLDSNPNVHLLNLEDALRQKQYDEAVVHLKYAWSVGKDNEEVEQQCLEILRALKKLGYAKDIHWGRERISSLLIGGLAICIVAFIICLLIWNIKVALITVGAYVIYIVSCLALESGNKLAKIISILVFGVLGIAVWCVIVYFICMKFWDVEIAKTAIKVVCVFGIIGTFGLLFEDNDKKS